VTNFNPQLTSQLAGAIAIAAVAGVVTLALLYAGIPFFGPVNDLINAASAILIAVFVWQFHPLIRERSAVLAVLLLLFAMAGVAAIAGNSVVVAFGRMDWKIGGMYTGIGYGLIGVWLAGMLLALKASSFPAPGLVTFGLILGFCMLLGFLAGPLLAGKLELEFKPLVWLAYAGMGGGWVLFPVWCWLLASRLK
jgi:hypothetical protein